MRFSRAERDPRRANSALQHVPRSLAIRTDPRSPPVDLFRFFRRDQIFSSDDLPAAVTLQPGVGPDEAPTVTGAFFPRLASLRNRGVTVKSNFHVVKPI
jgi:hypothetical protein